MRASIACALLLALASFTLAAPGSPSGAGPYRVGGKVSPPEKIGGAAPVYSEEARQARLQGVVLVEAIIDENGGVTNPRVTKGLPMGLSNAALAAVATWKFKPARLDGRPVKVYYTLQVPFQPTDTPGPDPLALLASLARERAGRPRAADAAELSRVQGELTAGRQTLAAALTWAKGYRGPSRAYALADLGRHAWRQITTAPALTPAAQNLLLDQGLEASGLALAANPNLLEAPLYKALLLQEKAKRTTDAGKRSALSAESAKLIQAAAESYRKTHPGAA